MKANAGESFQMQMPFNILSYIFSINTQVIIQNRALSLARYISDYQPIITSMDKTAASSRFATVNEDDFALKCFFYYRFCIITCVFILINNYSPKAK